MTIHVYPYREKLSMGNIIWAERNKGDAYYRVSEYAMRGGLFPRTHPVAPGRAGSNSKAEMGASPKLDAFRARGYWASCFPEGDGITWKPEQGQDDNRCLSDIRDCFGWPDVTWARR